MLAVLILKLNCSGGRHQKCSIPSVLFYYYCWLINTMTLFCSCKWLCYTADMVKGERDGDKGLKQGKKKRNIYLNHSLGVLPLLWSLFFSPFKRGEIRLSWNRRGREGVWEAEEEEERRRGGGETGIRICTLTKTNPTTTQHTLCVSLPFNICLLLFIRSPPHAAYSQLCEIFVFYLLKSL